MPSEARVLDRWPDGSLRWALLDFVADVDAPDAEWSIEIDAEAAAPSPGPVIAIDDRPDTIVVDTGAAIFAVDPAAAFPIARVTRSGREAIAANATGLRLSDDRGRAWQYVQRLKATIDRGRLRTSITMGGDWLDADGRLALRTVWHLHWFAGLSTVRCELVVVNPRAAAHPSGYWDLGDPASVRIGELSLRLSAPRAGSLRASLDAAAPLEAVAAPFSVSQRGSGGPNWKSPVHVDASGAVSIPIRGYERTAGGARSEGLRATPRLFHESAEGRIGVAVPQFWQHFPRELSGDETGLTLGLWPAGPGPYELQGGEQKTHRFYLAFGDDEVGDQPLAWCLAPTVLTAGPDAYVRAGAIPAQAGRPHPQADAYACLTARAFDAERGFVAKRERVDEFGWRHFGDLYADHEAVRHTGPEPFVSHYNNQYDAIAALATHFMRTGSADAWALMDDLARHVVDIDLYHTDADRAAYSRGLFWHTNHYTPAATATHRAYARSSGLPGGGPSNEHNYTTGLLLHHYLTGSPQSADAVRALAGWVVAMDDGARSRFRWIDRGPTGLASATYSPDYHGPGRGAANSINALLDAHRLTGDAPWLAAAEALIRRCIHPADDPAMHDLLDAERRWSYTVFLQVLGRYLDYKRERGAPDGMYAHARESLLTYARWMAAHEAPVLDRPERVEFPTETWAAQDLRKADVFNTARRFGRPEDRSAFVERRDFFFEYAVRTLSTMPTAACTRPLVLLLTNGTRVAYASTDDEVPYSPPGPFGKPERFLPQKQRVKPLVLMAAGLAMAAAVGFGLWAFR